MNQLFSIILNFLTAPPGNLIYHLVLAFSIAGALLGAIHLWRTTQFPQAKRAVLGLGILLTLQVSLFVVSGLAWQRFLDAGTILPPLDRAVTLLSIIWIAWLWIFPEPVRIADIATLLLNFLTLVFLGLSLVIWLQETPSLIFNPTTLGFVWQILSLAFVALGIVILSIRQPNGWGNGLAMLTLAFAGHLVTILLFDNGDFPGAVRLTHIVLFPILLTLVYRFQIPEIPAKPEVAKTEKPQKIEKVVKPEKTAQGVKSGKIEKVEKVTAARPAVEEKRRYSTDPKTLHALLTLAAETHADKIGNALTRSIAQATLADLCFLVIPEDNKELTITCGYDLIREENIGGTSLLADSVPMLANAIQRARPLRLPASSTSADLKGLGQALGLGNAGHLLSVPVNSSDSGMVGALLLLSPYSNRLWSTEDQAFLTNVAGLFVPILERGKKVTVLEQERNSASDLASSAQKKYEEISTQYQALHDTESQLQLQAQNMAAMVAKQEESQKIIDQLKAENSSLLQFGGNNDASSDQVEHELRMALEENAHLQNAVAEANIKILEMERRPAASISGDQAEVVASLSQELRQPMSSIVGYTDLLLGESVGILGALQRKFIERIKSSTERIGGLIDDLIHITTLETSHLDMKPEPVDLNLIIDNAVAYTSTQIREKNIALQLDTPETPPQIQTDREALQQIIIHLLQNAGSATPAEGTIGLQLQIQQQEQREYLQIQVTDSGGGIAPEDIDKVFERRYRADHTLIQGLGDTSVGLSIAKSLVDAQNGRIWVTSNPGTGATFSVLLPVNIPAAPEAG